MNPAHDWTGFYIGANVGGSFASATTTDDGGYNLAGAQANYSQDDLIGSGELGYNWQLSPGTQSFVLGAEIDAGYLGFNSSGVFPISPGGDTSGFAKVGAYGTARVRAGYAVGDWLPYVTGGLAVGDMHTGAIDTCVTFPCGAGSIDAESSHATVGWTVGAGLAYALPGNWSVKLEYLYVDLSQDATGISKLTGISRTFTTDVHANLVRLGVDYKF